MHPSTGQVEKELAVFGSNPPTNTEGGPENESSEELLVGVGIGVEAKGAEETVDGGRGSEVDMLVSVGVIGVN